MYFNKHLELYIIKAKIKHTASIVFLHGSGDSGSGISSWLSSLAGREGFFLPHIKYIFPSAPIRPYSPFGGQRLAVWFDRKAITPTSEEVVDSVDQSCAAVYAIIDKEISDGMPANRIMIGGFSMGGALALHLVYRYLPHHHPNVNISGAFALSSFLNYESAVYASIDRLRVAYPPLFQAHGDSDSLVFCDWGTKTSEQLRKRGINVEFKVYKNIGHEMVESEVESLKEWISQRLP